ncbi:MAG: hypothetical protein ACXAEU_17440 [Candidatus Hodarchaeales archaeon]
MAGNQDQKSKIEENGLELTDKIRDAMKESVMDFTGHFSTASAILAGFYMATCAFIISVRANESIIFTFLDEDLLAEIPFLADLAMGILTTINMAYLWPSHFEYMLLILISLFLLSLISYSCFLRVGMIQMKALRIKSKKVPEDKILAWQHRGTKTLLISLLFSFISLPWALLRFITENSFVMAILLLVIVISCLLLTFAVWELMKKIYELFTSS